VWQRQALRHGGTFLKHVIPAIIKPIHSLWHEVIGFLFLSFAVVFGFRTASYIRQFIHASMAEEPGLLMRSVMAGFCTLLLGGFGISSFLRARKITRS
jgi:hypothetical protein